MKDTEYPPYACKCCGVVNGDMFWDYIEHNKDTLTYGEVVHLSDEFDTYRKSWNSHAEAARQDIRNAKPRRRNVRQSNQHQSTRPNAN